MRYNFIKYGAITGTILLFLGLSFDLFDLATELTLFILFLTFLAILWYSMETQELKEISIKRPCLSFNNNGREVCLKNYGEGVARDVEIRIKNIIIHKIPLISSIYSNASSPLPFSSEVNLDLITHRGEISIVYYDTSRQTQYLTIVEWDESLINRDKCKIIKYEWRSQKGSL